MINICISKISKAWGGGTKVGRPRWPLCPYMVKALKNLLWYQKADDLESWYTASVLEYYQVYWNDDPGFYGKVKFGPLCFWEKGKTMDFSKYFVVLWYQSWRSCSQLNEYLNLYKFHRSSSFIDLHPSHSDSTFSNVVSSETARPTEAKFYLEPPIGMRNESEYKWFLSHDQDGHHVNIW